MRIRNSVCYECDRGNRATRGKPVEQRGEEHTNSNHMRQTPTVHSGNGTRVLRGDKRVPSPLCYSAPPIHSVMLREWSTRGSLKIWNKAIPIPYTTVRLQDPQRR